MQQQPFVKVYHRDNYEQGVAKIMMRDPTRTFHPWSQEQKKRYADVLQLRSDANSLLVKTKAMMDGRSPPPTMPMVLQSRI